MGGRRGKKGCSIDATPPIVQTETYMRTTFLREDQENFKRILTQNAVLLEKLNKIQRLTGEVNCYNKSTSVRKTMVPAKIKWLGELEQENFVKGQRILCIKPTMNTRPVPPKRDPQKTFVHSEINKELFKQYHDVLPSPDINLVPRILRPKIFFDLEIKNVPLDRIVIVMYTEVAPCVVLHFAKMCKAGGDAFKFNRIYPNLWIEGKVDIPDGQKYGPIVKDSPSIDHSQSGTLCLLDRGATDCYEFSLSLKPLNVLNGESVAFGKVIRGMKMLNMLQDWGTKNGKMKKPIIIRNCGLMK